MVLSETTVSTCAGLLGHAAPWIAITSPMRSLNNEGQVIAAQPAADKMTSGSPSSQRRVRKERPGMSKVSKNSHWLCWQLSPFLTVIVAFLFYAFQAWLRPAGPMTANAYSHLRHTGCCVVLLSWLTEAFDHAGNPGYFSGGRKSPVMSLAIDRCQPKTTTKNLSSAKTRCLSICGARYGRRWQHKVRLLLVSVIRTTSKKRPGPSS